MHGHRIDARNVRWLSHDGEEQEIDLCSRPLMRAWRAELVGVSGLRPYLRVLFIRHAASLC